MIPTDDNRGFQFAVAHHLVESQSEPVTLTQSNPADTGRQTLEMNPFAGHIQPVMQMGIVRN